MAIATVQGGSYDLSTASGRMTARVVGAVSRHESEHKSERIRAKAAEVALEGKPSMGGDRPFGYEDDRVSIRESEAVHVKDAAMRILAGGSIRSLVLEWNNAGIVTTRGNQWSPANFTRMMRSARIAGLRSHKGEVVADAIWPGIITAEDHYALRALFDNNAKRMKRSPRKYLLTGGLAVCGLCGADLVSRPRGDGQPCMVCARGPGFHGCGKIRVLAEPLEGWIRDAVVEALAGPGLAEAIADVESADSDPSSVMGEIATLEESLRQLSVDHYSDKLISRAEFFAAKADIASKISGLADRATSRARSEMSRGLIGQDIADVWAEEDLGWRRQLVELVVDKVIVNPAVKGRNRFDPSRFEIVWKA